MRYDTPVSNLRRLASRIAVTLPTGIVDRQKALYLSTAILFAGEIRDGLVEIRTSLHKTLPDDRTKGETSALLILTETTLLPKEG